MTEGVRASDSPALRAAITTRSRLPSELEEQHLALFRLAVVELDRAVASYEIAGNGIAAAAAVDLVDADVRAT
jgi:hypothetical protein